MKCTDVSLFGVKAVLQSSCEKMAWGIICINYEGLYRKSYEKDVTAKYKVHMTIVRFL